MSAPQTLKVWVTHTFKFPIGYMVRFHQTIRWGAEKRQTQVDITVKAVKRMRQTLSTTIPANFHSDIMSVVASSSRIRCVIKRISRKIADSSRCELKHGVTAGFELLLLGTDVGVPSILGPMSCTYPLVDPAPDMVAAVAPALLDPLRCNLKSSSMSKTFANRLLEDRSLMFGGLGVLPEAKADAFSRAVIFAGRCIRKIQGSHRRNKDFIWEENRMQ